MKQTTLAQLSKIEDLLRDRQYDRVLDALASTDRSTLSRRDRGWWYLQFSEAKLYKGRCREVEDELREAVEIFRHDPETEKYALAKFLLGWMYASLGDYVSAIEAYTDANAHYDRCGNKRGCARTLNKLAYPQFQMGQMDAAIRNVKRSIAILRDLSDIDKADSYSGNLATLQFRAGHLTEAITGYSRLMLDVEKREDRTAQILFQMAAVAYVQKGNVTKAKKMLQRCQPYLSTFERDDAVYYENLGLAKIADGNYTAAEKDLRAGLKIALKIAPESSLVSQIKRLFGDLYLVTGKFDLAKRYGKEALAVAEKIGERAEIAACYRIFAQVEQVKGNADKARDWYLKAIDLFGLIGSNYELAVTRYLAGTSGLYVNGECQALLWMARRYFDSEKVAPYLEKIDKAFSSTPSLPVVRVAAVPTVIAKSKVMTEIVSLAEQVAQTSMTVFLTGPTGTGKDLLARYIHCYSGRTGEFVSVNAAAIPNPMIESELFGHKKGSFTGSEEDRAGLIEQADNGTFYLNEIADASMEFQTKLLEVLETRHIRRLGENKTRPVSFRLIAATNHNLQQCISKGKFRLDLYHRLNEIPIELPPLSERTEDIPALVSYFLGKNGNGYKINGNRKSLERLGFVLSMLDYDGNIRELKNRVERLRHMSCGDIEQMFDLLLNDDSLSECDRLRRVLEHTGWNRREAARRLGVSEAIIRKRILKFGLTQAT